MIAVSVHIIESPRTWIEEKQRKQIFRLLQKSQQIFWRFHVLFVLFLWYFLCYKFFDTKKIGSQYLKLFELHMLYTDWRKKHTRISLKLNLSTCTISWKSKVIAKNPCNKKWFFVVLFLPGLHSFWKDLCISCTQKSNLSHSLLSYKFFYLLPYLFVFFCKHSS